MPILFVRRHDCLATSRKSTTNIFETTIKIFLFQKKKKQLFYKNQLFLKTSLNLMYNMMKNKILILF